MAALAVLAAMVVAAGPAAAQTSIGVYSDTGGTDCTLSDLTPGVIIELYVVVRPQDAGATAVQFAAPTPACFPGVYLGDVDVAGTLKIGNSQNGVSISLLGCRFAPMHVLTIQYVGTGTTPACCDYPVIADPAVPDVLFVDCNFLELPADGVVSHFNADETCPCVGNTPPRPPDYPDPPDGAESVSVEQDLSWQAFDVDNNITGFDVYLGTDPSPPLVASDVPAPSYDPGQLTPLARHYWRVVVRDAAGAERSGPVWSFTTREINSPPFFIGGPIPADGATGVGLSITLVWSAGDIDGDPLVYDVYFGASPDPPLVATNLHFASYVPLGLTFSTLYYWRVVARDPPGHETSSPLWSFTTRPGNRPPNAPSSPVPPNASVDQPVTSTLAWQCTDPDGDVLRFDVYLGTASPPPLVAANHTQKSYNPGPLAFSTQYYWRIVARDPSGSSTSGPQWTFATAANSPPAAPSNPSPPNNSIDRSVTSKLSWQCSDVDGHAITYDVYFGTFAPPPQVASGVTTKSYDPGMLSFATKHYWRIVARDALGAETSGPEWNFTTAADQPPNAPSNPNPPNGGIASVQPTLTWTASDPGGQPLTFDVYFGTSSPPPPAASGLVTARYEPGTLEVNTTYYWRVVASDGTFQTSGPTWRFTTQSPAGSATVGIYGDGTGNGCNITAPTFAPMTAYVVLNPGPGATGVQFAAPQPPCYDGTYSGDVVAGGLISIGNTQSGIAIALGGCVTEPLLLVTMNYFSFPGTASPCCVYPVVNDPSVFDVLIVDCAFVEYPLTALPAVINPDETCLCGGPPTPVLISRFDAKATPDGVHVRWELSGDELAERYTLLRREGSATQATIAGEGAVTGTTGSFLDASVEAGTTYLYQLVLRTARGEEFRSPEVTVTTAAVELMLGQNRPNPFNPQTVIPYTLASGSKPVRVRLFILDAAGRVVRTLVDEEHAGGTREAVWDGKDDRGGGVSSGVYFCVLDADGRRLTRKLVLLK